jgi:hypothetical protein
MLPLRITTMALLAVTACAPEQPRCAGATSIPPVVAVLDDTTGGPICDPSFELVDASGTATQSLDDGGARACDAIPTSAACMQPVPDGGGRCDFALTGVNGPLGATQYTVLVTSPGYRSQSVVVVAGVQSLCGEVLQNSSRVVVRLTQP